MKYVAGALIIVLLLILGASLVNRLLAPFSGAGGQTPVASASKNDSQSDDKKDLPLPEEMSTAAQALQEKARQNGLPDGGHIYAVNVEQNITDGRPVIVATVEYTPSRSPEVFWTAISKKYSRIEIGDLALNPVSIEGSAEFESAVQQLATTSYAVNFDEVRSKLESMPASERLVAGKARRVRLTFRAPDNFVVNENQWSRLLLTGVTNQTFAGHDNLHKEDLDPKEFRNYWEADLYIPRRNDNEKR